MVMASGHEDMDIYGGGWCYIAYYNHHDAGKKRREKNISRKSYNKVRGRHKEAIRESLLSISVGSADLIHNLTEGGVLGKKKGCAK